jgi:hypothetical protein
VEHHLRSEYKSRQSRFCSSISLIFQSRRHFLSSIEHAAHAREHGVTANTRFEVATAKGYPERGFDLLAFFDCLNDMGDPADAAAHVRQSLRPDGSWMIIERAIDSKTI